METTNEKRLKTIAKLTKMQKCNEKEITNLNVIYWRTIITNYNEMKYAATILKNWEKKTIYIGIYHNLYKAEDLRILEIINHEDYAKTAIYLLKKEITKGE